MRILDRSRGPACVARCDVKKSPAKDLFLENIDSHLLKLLNSLLQADFEYRISFSSYLDLD